MGHLLIIYVSQPIKKFTPFHFILELSSNTFSFIATSHSKLLQCNLSLCGVYGLSNHFHANSPTSQLRLMTHYLIWSWLPQQLSQCWHIQFTHNTLGDYTVHSPVIYHSDLPSLDFHVIHSMANLIWFVTQNGCNITSWLYLSIFPLHLWIWCVHQYVESHTKDKLIIQIQISYNSSIIYVFLYMTG